jgi:hypothetical protein
VKLPFAEQQFVFQEVVQVISAALRGTVTTQFAGASVKMQPLSRLPNPCDPLYAPVL